MNERVPTTRVNTLMTDDGIHRDYIQAKKYIHLYLYRSYNLCSIQKFVSKCYTSFVQVAHRQVIYIVVHLRGLPGMKTNNYILSPRGWQRKLYSLVQNAANRTELYQCLCLLITCSESEQFQEHLKDVLSAWSGKEPKFIEYFQTTYANRTGR